MIPAATVITFFTASVLLALAPGPDNIFVLTQSAVSGRRSGLAVTGGLCTGLLVHTAAVAIGVAAVFQTSAAAFSILKYIGSAYLLYLAFLAFKSSAEMSKKSSPRIVGLMSLYRRGIILNITNPKVSIFFLAFLPQFTDPARGPVSIQMIILGAIFIFATVIVFGGIALLSGSISLWYNRSPRVHMILNRIAGTVFLGLAVRLAFIQR